MEPPSPPPSRIASEDRAIRLLESAFSELGLEPSSRQLAQLAKLAVLLESWASRINLTGHKTLESMLEGLIVEALALEAAIPGRFESLADIGSGAGFPGLPIAVIRTECRVTLLEPREKRHHFQKAAIRELEAANVTALRGRTDQLVAAPHRAAIAQALANPGRALRWLRDWVEVDGLAMLALSYPIPDFQIPPGFEPLPVVPYSVPLTGRRRVLWSARRTPLHVVPSDP